METSASWHPSLHVPCVFQHGGLKMNMLPRRLHREVCLGFSLLQFALSSLQDLSSARESDLGMEEQGRMVESEGQIFHWLVNRMQICNEHSFCTTGLPALSILLRGLLLFRCSEETTVSHTATRCEPEAHVPLGIAHPIVTYQCSLRS